MSTVSEVDPESPIRAPMLNEHREAILAELMAKNGAYAPTSRPHCEADETNDHPFVESIAKA